MRLMPSAQHVNMVDDVIVNDIMFFKTTVKLAI